MEIYKTTHTVTSIPSWIALWVRISSALSFIIACWCKRLQCFYIFSVPSATLAPQTANSLNKVISLPASHIPICQWSGRHLGQNVTCAYYSPPFRNSAYSLVSPSMLSLLSAPLWLLRNKGLIANQYSFLGKLVHLETSGKRHKQDDHEKGDTYTHNS